MDVLSLIPSQLATIVACPEAIPETTPDAETAATSGAELAHSTERPVSGTTSVGEVGRSTAGYARDGEPGASRLEY